MAPLGDQLVNLWRRAMLRGSSFSGSYRKLQGLYLKSDPWEMASDREQHRFRVTNAELEQLDIAAGSILELGCGEGHQSVHLSELCRDFTGVDLSAKAVARARDRVPSATFYVAQVEQLPSLFACERFDLITACEVLYYLPDVAASMATLYELSDQIFVSNFSDRSAKMRQHFTGPGWRQLDDISHGATAWECFIWIRPDESDPNRDRPG